MKINKKTIAFLVALVIFILLIIFFTIYFIIPSFKGDRYGDRLEDENKYKITNEVVSSIKDEVTKQDGVKKVKYHKEGRVLNFTITTDGSVDVKVAKNYAKIVTDKLTEKNKKYYDVQILLDTKEEMDGYPNIGYKHKSSDEFSWGNAGVNHE